MLKRPPIGGEFPNFTERGGFGPLWQDHAPFALSHEHGAVAVTARLVSAVITHHAWFFRGRVIVLPFFGGAAPVAPSRNCSDRQEVADDSRRHTTLSSIIQALSSR